MPAYTVKKFGGSIPRLDDSLLGEDNASQALDCRLWHGRLEPWRNPLLVDAYTGSDSPAPGTINTAFYWECCWVRYTTCVDIAIGPVTCKKLFTTGDQAWPAIVEIDDACNQTVRRLGLPCGGNAPSVTLGSLNESAPKDTEFRTYAYQYVNAAGERGELSNAAEPQLIRDGQSVVISGWDLPDGSWGDLQVNIYRTVKGYQQPGKDRGNVLDTTWMLVGTAGVSDSSFTDSALNETLIQGLEEDIAPPPPANLTGLVYLATANALAGFIGAPVYFSENNVYHQWPYYLDLDDDICGLCESHNILYVTTTGNPYIIVGPVEGKEAHFREAIRLPADYPMVGCGNRKIAATPFGCVYPSHNGLVMLNGLTALRQRVAVQERNPVQMLTTPFYAPDDWQALLPESAIPIVHESMLFVFMANGGFVMRLPSSPEEGWPLDAHTDLSDTGVLQAFVPRTGELFLLKNDGVYQWDRGSTLRSFDWTSPENVTPVPVNFAACNLQFEGAAVTLTITNEAGQTFTRPVLSKRQFRLPEWLQGSRWKVRLQGAGSVRLFSMATSMRELGT